MINFLVLLFLTIPLIPIQFSWMPSISFLLSVIIGFSCLIKFKNYGLNKSILLYFVVLILLTLINLLRTGGKDLSMLYQLIYGFSLLLALKYLSCKYINSNGTFWKVKILRDLYWIGLIHAIIQIGMLLSGDLYKSVSSVFLVSESAAIHVSQGYRSPGLFYLGAAPLSVFNALILITGLYAYLGKENKHSLISTIFISAGTIIMIVSIIFSGRSGFVVLFIFIAMYAAISFSKIKKQTIRLELARFFFIITCILIFSFFYFDFYIFDGVIRFAFELIINYIETGKISSASTDDLFANMYFLPESSFHILFGDGNFGRSNEFDYIHSDSGYILTIFGSGFLGLIVYYSFFILTLWIVYKSNSDYLFVYLFIVVSYLILNFKDNYFMQNSGVFQILAIYFYISSGFEKKIIKTNNSYVKNSN